MKRKQSELLRYITDVDTPAMTARKSEQQKGPASEGAETRLKRGYQLRSWTVTNPEAILGVGWLTWSPFHVNLIDERYAI
jgi:hypothetical protein